MSLTVKAYLQKSSAGDQEIRRFAADEGAISNYTYLTNKICQVFPNLNDKALTYYWKDPENDLIAFSSDEELTNGLGYVQDGIFRVYIKPREAEESEVHLNVICDGCEKTVCGSRFKCTVCPDYDLCGQCMVKVKHPHRLNRISRQDAMSFPPWMAAILQHITGQGGAAHGGPAYGGPPPPHAGPPPPHAGPPPPHAGPPPPHAGHQQFGGPWGGPGGWLGGPCGGGPPFARRFWRRAWRRWMQEQGIGPWGMFHQGDEEPATVPTPGAQDCKKSCKAKKAAAKVEEAPPTAAGAEDSAKPRNTTGEEPAPERNSMGEPASEYLQNVGDHVAAMLDPLGIDVEVDVEHHGHRRRCRRGGGMNRHGAWGNRGGHWGPWGGWGWGYGSGFPGGRYGQWGDYMGQAQTSTQQQQQQQQQQQPDSRDVDMESTSTNPEAGEQSPDRPKDLSMKTPSVSNTTSPDNSGWTLLGREQDGSCMEMDGSSEGKPEGGSTAQSPVPKPGSHIEQAVAHLTSMGFNNDDGQLTRLVQEKGSDINKVLDSLRSYLTEKPQQ